MKRFSLFVLLLLLAIAGAVYAQSPGISYPPETEVLRGVVEILGTANDPNFWKYELAALPFGTSNEIPITGAETPVINGVLGQWDTRTVPDGPYSLRLRVVRLDANYDTYFVVRVQVANAAPPPTPTSQVTPTPTITPTPRPATATPVVLTPELPTPTPPPATTPTAVPGSVGGDDGGDEAGGSGSEGESESPIAALTARLSGLGSAFLRGAGAVLLVFLAIGFFFGVKYLLTWLYYRLLASR